MLNVYLIKFDTWCSLFRRQIINVFHEVASFTHTEQMSSLHIFIYFDFILE